MRIPWYYTIPASLLVFFTVLYFGARSYDFTENPSENEIEETKEKWHAFHPPLPSRETPLPEKYAPKPPIAATPSPIPPVTEPATPNPQPKPPIAASGLESINTEISPSLSHFSEIQHTELPKLAKLLETNKHTELARLAWERVLESKQASTSQKSDAASSIKKLRSQTALWSPDASSQIPLTVEITVASNLVTLAESIRFNLSANITQFSGGIIKPTITVKGIAAKSGFPPPPSSLTIKGKSGKTTTMRFTSPSATKDSLSTQFYFAIYNSIRNNAKKQGALNPPVEIPSTTSPKQALANYVSRLTWRTFARSLTQ